MAIFDCAKLKKNMGLSTLFQSLNTTSGDIIDLPNKGTLGRAVSFDYIMRTGNIPASNPISTMLGRDLHVDLHKNDPYTQALFRITENTIQRINSLPEAKSLLDLKDWSRKDRASWESLLSNIAAEEMRKIPSFNEYRTEGQTQGVERSSSLNALSHDILSPDSSQYEFDCEHMSATLGLAMQGVEQQILGRPSPIDSLRNVHNYYYTVGTVFEKNGKTFVNEGGHALIISSATGNITQAVNVSGNPFAQTYQDIQTPGHSFANFIRTGSVVMYNNQVFSGSDNSVDARTSYEAASQAEWCQRRKEEDKPTPATCTP